MALIVTDNSVRQINAALLSLEKKIGETNSEKAQDKQVVQMEIKNAQYNFMAPLHQSGNSVSINTTGTWEGNARSATNAEHASTADNVEHANTADTATSADTATTATNANLSKTLDTVNGDKLQIGNGTAQNVTNAKHAANAEHAVTADNGVPTYSTSDAGKNLAVNSSGNAVGWVKPQTIKIVDYKTGQFNWTAVGQQERVELSNFGPDVTESNVLSFMVIYWSSVKTIAQADWAISQGTGSIGMACALTALGTGTGYSVIRCVYLA